MTVTLPLTSDQEAQLAALAKERGVSLDSLITGFVGELLSAGQPASTVEELFSTFDSLNPPPEVCEEAFHRENWYR